MSQRCLATVDEGHNVLWGVSLFLLDGEPLRASRTLVNTEVNSWLPPSSARKCGERKEHSGHLNKTSQSCFVTVQQKDTVLYVAEVHRKYILLKTYYLFIQSTLCSEISQWLLDGLSWYLVQMCMVPWGWIPTTLVNPGSTRQMFSLSDSLVY